MHLGFYNYDVGFQSRNSEAGEPMVFTTTLLLIALINVSLRGEYTLLIVTHNMQQEARVSDYTAFTYLGLLVEVSPTNVMFRKSARRRSETYVTGRFGQGAGTSPDRWGTRSGYSPSRRSCAGVSCGVGSC